MRGRSTEGEADARAFDAGAPIIILMRFTMRERAVAAEEEEELGFGEYLTKHEKKKTKLIKFHISAAAVWVNRTYAFSFKCVLCLSSRREKVKPPSHVLKMHEWGREEKTRALVFFDLKPQTVWTDSVIQPQCLSYFPDMI